MINFIVCDDFEYIRKNVAGIIDSIMMQNEYEYKVYSYADYDKNFIKDMNSISSNKIYILDIETPTNSGIDIARRIRKNDIDSIIIFLTSHYELGSTLLEDEIMFLTFISKFNNYEERLKSALNKALTMIGKRNAIRFEDHGILYTIPINDILYVTKDSVNRKCVLKTDYSTFLINKTIADFVKMLGNDFIKTHRSCLINKERVRVLNKKDKMIVLDNGEIVRLLSHDYRKEVCLND